MFARPSVRPSVHKAKDGFRLFLAILINPFNTESLDARDAAASTVLTIKVFLNIIRYASENLIMLSNAKAVLL